MQKDSDGLRHVFAYYSRRASAAESKYTPFELETLAIVYALKVFCVYLLGINFTTVTDCNSIKSAEKKKYLTPRIGRWFHKSKNLHTS